MKGLLGDTNGMERVGTGPKRGLLPVQEDSVHTTLLYGNDSAEDDARYPMNTT